MNKYIKNYHDAATAMKEAAIKAMMEYGKTLEVPEECKKRLIAEKAYKNEREIQEDELNDYILDNTYRCFLIGKHEQIYLTNIVMVRYNQNTKDVDAYLETNEGDVAEWFPVSRIDGEHKAVYLTILEFLGEN